MWQCCGLPKSWRQTLSSVQSKLSVCLMLGDVLHGFCLKRKSPLPPQSLHTGTQNHFTWAESNRSGYIKTSWHNLLQRLSQILGGKSSALPVEDWDAEYLYCLVPTSAYKKTFSSCVLDRYISVTTENGHEKSPVDCKHRWNLFDLEALVCHQKGSTFPLSVWALCATSQGPAWRAGTSLEIRTPEPLCCEQGQLTSNEKSFQPAWGNFCALWTQSQWNRLISLSLGDL